MKHFKYLRYVAVHKWFVLVECWKRGLYWRGLVHDWSKFLPSEWVPYTNFFYGQPPPDSNTHQAGYQKPTDTGNAAFEHAWLLHQKHNDHHWQWWLLSMDDGGTTLLEMSMGARTEMLCDWIGAGKAQGKSDTAAWYEQAKAKMQLGPATRAWIENELNTEKD